MCHRVAVATLAIVICAAAPSPDHCANFTPGRRFSESSLAGTIWMRPDRPAATADLRPTRRSGTSAGSLPTSEDLFAGATYSWFYELTDKERVAYAIEMRQHFPDVDWGRVRYSWNFDNPSLGGPDSFRYLIEVGQDEEGDVRAVPVDAIYRHLPTAAPLRYRFRQLPNSLAVAYCAAPHIYTLQTPTPTVFST